MIKLNPKQASHDPKFGMIPVMHVHRLKSDEPGFPKKPTDCYITEMSDNGRYAVFSASGIDNSFYKVYGSIQEVHEKFNES